MRGLKILLTATVVHAVEISIADFDATRPSCWKRLGKSLLDAGEHAEAQRIF
jgi:hypothetical protein